MTDRNKNKSKNFIFRMTNEEYLIMKSLAKYFGTTSSDVLRLCLKKVSERLEPNWKNKIKIFEKRKEIL
jgi:hypothetical protein